MWKSRVMFAVCMVGAVLLVRYDERLGFTAIYALLILFILALCAILVAPWSLRIEENLDRTEMFKNEQFAYRATIRNRGPFYYPYVNIARHNTELIEYGVGAAAILPRGRIRAACDTVLRYRGEYSVGIQKLTVTDFLGLFQVQCTVDNPLSITVYPEEDVDFAVYIRNNSQNASFRTELFNESYADVADVRKYDPSDSLRKVHWKLSAKRNELMVKNYHSFDPNETTLFLDPVRPALEGAQKAAFEDRMVAFAAAAVGHCLTGRLTAWLAYGEGQNECVALDAAEDPDKLYRLLARIPFEREYSPFPAFCYARGESNIAFNLLLFTCRMDEEVFDALRQLQSYEHGLFVYHFSCAEAPATEDEDYYLGSLQALGIAVNRIQVDDTAGLSQGAKS